MFSSSFLHNFSFPLFRSLLVSLSFNRIILYVCLYAIRNVLNCNLSSSVFCLFITVIQLHHFSCVCVKFTTTGKSTLLPQTHFVHFMRTQMVWWVMDKCRVWADVVLSECGWWCDEWWRSAECELMLCWVNVDDGVME